MRIERHKIPAFSLQEMVVVLIITTIIVGMAFSVLNLVQKQMGSIQTIYEVKTDVNKLRQSLWIDFNRYADIRYDQKKGQINALNEIGSRRYEITDGNYIRNENGLEIAFESINFYFENRLVLNGQIDAIEIMTSKDTGFQQIFVFRDNTPVTFINQ